MPTVSTAVSALIYTAYADVLLTAAAVMRMFLSVDFHIILVTIATDAATLNIK